MIRTRLLSATFRALFILLCACPVSFDAQAEEESANAVVVEGDQVEFLAQENRVIGEGNIRVTYEDVVLTCDRVIVFNDSRDALAQGSVKIRQDVQVLEGRLAHYNFRTKKGTLLEAGFKAEAAPVWWYGKADTIDKTSLNELFAENGYLTSCSLAEPHYRIAAKKFWILSGDQVRASNVVMYLGSIPVVYLPWWNYSLRDDRPKISVAPGKDSEWGAFVKTATRYELTQQSKGYINNDYFENRGWGKGFDHYYQTGNYGDGKFRLYHLYERRPDRPEGHSAENERWRVQARHQWDIDEDSEVTVEFHRQSDSLFLRDYYEREEYELESDPLSYVSWVSNKPNQTTSLLVQKRLNRFQSQVEYLPEFTHRLNNFPIGDNVQMPGKLGHGQFYWTSNSSATSATRKYASPSDLDLDHARVDTHQQLSYSSKLAGWLQVTPRAGVQQTMYSKDVSGDETKVRGAFDTGMDLSTRFFRIFDVSTNKYGLDINRLRHVIAPSVDYSYRHSPTILPRKIQQIDGVDSLARLNTMTFRLENKLQTKRRRKFDPFMGKAYAPQEGPESVFYRRRSEETNTFGLDSQEDELEVTLEEEDQLTNVDLVRFVLSIPYFFAKEDGSEFGNLFADLEIEPYPWLLFETDARYNTDTRDVDTVNVDVVARPTESRKLNLGVGHRYVKNQNTQLTSQISFPLGEKWWLGAYQRFDFKRIESGKKEINDLVEQEYSIMRDLHCWTVEVNYNVTRERGESVWFVFRLKGYSEAPLLFETSYHEPKFGSQTPP
ncbi:MAG: LPS-assembly protein LptD [Candidatus Omnitrophica bacterium]|nr:LPS-assembly protein LptD [Candidatus Omnitrophota bacterium]